MCIRFVLACMCSAVASVSGRSAPLFKLSDNVGKGLLFLLCTAVRLDILMCRARFGNIYIDVHTWKCTYGCLKIHLTKIWEPWYKLGYFLRIYLKLIWNGLPQEEATMSSGMAQGLQKVSKVPRSWKKSDPPPGNLQNTKDPLPMYWFKGTPVAQLVDCASLNPPLCICQCSFPHPHTMCITLKDTPTQDQMVQF